MNLKSKGTSNVRTTTKAKFRNVSTFKAETSFFLLSESCFISCIKIIHNTTEIKQIYANWLFWILRLEVDKFRHFQILHTGDLQEDSSILLWFSF